MIKWNLLGLESEREDLNPKVKDPGSLYYVTTDEADYLLSWQNGETVNSICFYKLPFTDFDDDYCFLLLLALSEHIER